MTKTVAFWLGHRIGGNYFTNGNTPLFDWHAITPWWVADWFPNIESEIGCLVVIAGMIPLYWPLRDD